MKVAAVIVQENRAMYITMSETGNSPATNSSTLPSGMVLRFWSKDEFLRIAAFHGGCSVKEILSHRRESSIVRVRWACYLALINRGKSYPQAGLIMNRDHTTIIHGVKKARELIENDESFRAIVDALG
jgi:chromosomal replication initiation ATPase DnaA